MAWLRPSDVLASGGDGESLGGSDWARSVPGRTGGWTAPAVPRPDGRSGAGPVGEPAAMAGMMARTAAGWPPDPTRTKAEAITAAEEIAPAAAISTPALGPRRPRRG